ncbi:MAG: ATP-binding cassette domain-containing protein [Gammaproteobacteria bacterium]|nr:ATP-binding cassette domain-containing protein [Gammaproteobacteria bacterium]
MPLLSLKAIHLGFGGPDNLLDGVSLSVENGERACLLGRNGAGKSTLLRLIAGELQPDEGERAIQQGARVAHLTQEIPEGIGGSVFDVVASGLGPLGEIVRSYHRLATELASGADKTRLAALAEMQQQLEAADGWQTEQRTEAVISRLSLDADAPFAALSGGLKRRVLLARALVVEPDLLLLDEPTNHLDIESIDWLEGFLLGYPGAVLFVTHDRMFLQRLASRIIELDRGLLYDWPGDYANYQRRKEAQLNGEEKLNQRFDKRLAQEEIWIRQGIKARRTRNEGRVRALEAMREARARRREQAGQVRMSLQDAGSSGKLVAEVVDISYRWDRLPVISRFSTTILRGDRIGVIGPNGAGKSTLLNLLLGRLAPDTGTVRLGTRLEIAYFDQMRVALDAEKSVADNLAEGSDKVVIGGQPKHVISYLQDFLFTPDRARQPVKALSGGERNRLLLAKLFARPANVLVLDEPTNDLDMETLELLEELLMEYEGTLLLVSHDRFFLNRVVTSTLVLEGDGRVAEYVGGYDDWLRQRKPPAIDPPVKPRVSNPRPATRPKKLSYKDQRELAELPKKIESLEAELEAVQAIMADPDFYRSEGGQINEMNTRLSSLETVLASSYARWEALESLLDGEG